MMSVVSMQPFLRSSASCYTTIVNDTSLTYSTWFERRLTRTMFDQLLGLFRRASCGNTASFRRMIEDPVIHCRARCVGRVQLLSNRFNIHLLAMHRGNKSSRLVSLQVRIIHQRTSITIDIDQGQIKAAYRISCSRQTHFRVAIEPE
jgi:hypothetical protein